MTGLLILYLVVSLVPFAGAVGLLLMSGVEYGEFYSHIFLVYALLFWALGLGVHSFAPIYLFNDFFDRPGGRAFRRVLFIAPVLTLLWMGIILFGN